MRIIITENRLTNLINSTLGYDLSDRIVMITNWEEAPIDCRYMFPSEERFNALLNNWGPMFFIYPKGNGKWLAQQREGGEWFIYKEYYNDQYGVRIDEGQLLSFMGVSMFGIPLDVIIDNFVVEE